MKGKGIFGRVAERMKVSALSPTAVGQMTPAGLMTGRAAFGRAPSTRTRRRAARTTTRAARAAAPKRRAVRARSRGGKLVKGSAAAKAWGAKMRRARRRK